MNLYIHIYIYIYIHTHTHTHIHTKAAIRLNPKPQSLKPYTLYPETLYPKRTKILHPKQKHLGTRRVLQSKQHIGHRYSGTALTPALLRKFVSMLCIGGIHTRYTYKAYI